MPRPLEAREIAPGRYVVVDPDSAAEAARRIRDLLDQAEAAAAAWADIREGLDRVRALLRGRPASAAPAQAPRPNPDHEIIPDAERGAWQ